MSKEVSIVIRGACGIDVQLERSKKGGRFYTSKTCNNSALSVGSAPTTVRKTCEACEHANKNEASAIAPEPILKPASKSTPPTPKPVVAESATPAFPSFDTVLPIDVPEPTAVVVPEPTAASVTVTAVAAAPMPQPMPQHTQQAVEVPQTPAFAPPVSSVRSAQQPTQQPVELPINVPPPGTPVIAASGNSNDSGLVPGVVVGPPTPEGQLPVQYPEEPVSVVVNPSEIQVDRQGALPIVLPPQSAGLPTTVAPPVAVEQIAASAAVSPPPLSGGGTFLPGIDLAGVADQDEIDIDALLNAIPGMDGGPSTGGFSWSTLKVASTCWRMTYYSHVLALSKSRSSKALKVGSLVHACFEMHYKSGGTRTFEPCEVVAAAGAVEIAADARRYVYAQLQKYGAEEAATWDVRGVELQGTWFMPPVKIGSRKVYIPLTCRHDILVALREHGGPCVPPGKPVPHGVFICDWKTCHAMSYELTKGYGMDGQFLMNGLIYRQAESEQFGPLAGIVVSIIAKHKKMTPDKSLFRVHTSVNNAMLDEFYHTEIKPLSIALYSRLSGEDREDRAKWPKNHGACVTRYGTCPYFDICDNAPGEAEDMIIEQMYTSDPSRIKRVEEFLQPPLEVKRIAGKTEDQVSNEKKKRDSDKAIRDGYKNSVKNAFVASVAQFEAFQSRVYLGKEDATQKGIKASVLEMLSEAWPIGTKFTLPADEEHVDITTTSKGITWTLPSMRGTFTWRTLMNAVTADWWNPAANEPSAAPVTE